MNLGRFVRPHESSAPGEIKKSPVEGRGRVFWKGTVFGYPQNGALDAVKVIYETRVVQAFPCRF